MSGPVFYNPAILLKLNRIIILLFATVQVEKNFIDDLEFKFYRVLFLSQGLCDD